jgi:hypothetical protein
MFFLFEKIKSDDITKSNRKVLLRFAFRILCMYLVWALVYYACRGFYQYYNGISHPYTPFGVILDFFARGVHYHLWYLIATIYALPVVYLLWRGGRVFLIVACLVLHGLQCLDVPYHFAPIFDHPAVSFFVEEYDIIARTILHAIPLMCLGVLCKMDVSKYEHKTWRNLLLAALVIFFVELAALLLVQGTNMKMERSFTSIFMIYCLINWAVTLDFHFPKKWIGKALRVSSIWIYCIHPLVRVLYHWIFAYQGMIRFVVVSGVTLVSAAVYTVVSCYLDRRHKLRQGMKENILP